MRSIILLAFSALFLGCSNNTSQDELRAALEQAKAVGLITTKAEAVAASYRGPLDRSSLYVLTSHQADLAKHVARFAPGGDVRAVAADLAELGPVVKQLERAAEEGTLPVRRDWSHPFEMPCHELSRMRTAATFFGGRAVYLAQTGDLDGSFTDLRHAAAIHRQTTGVRFLLGKLAATSIAALGERAITRVAGYCFGDPLRLAELQEIASAFGEVSFREALGFEIINSMDALDILASDTQRSATTARKNAMRVIEAARIEVLRQYIDLARSWPNIKPERKVATGDAEVDRLVTALLFDPFETAQASLAQHARREMTLLGLGILRKRSESGRWDLSAISSSSDPFTALPYKHVSTSKSLKIYSPGPASMPGRVRAEFDYKDW